MPCGVLVHSAAAAGEAQAAAAVAAATRGAVSGTPLLLLNRTSSRGRSTTLLKLALCLFETM